MARVRSELCDVLLVRVIIELGNVLEGLLEDATEMDEKHTDWVDSWASLALS